MPDPIHYHRCPRCGRNWALEQFMQLPDLGIDRREGRVDGQIVIRHVRNRRCLCGQLLEQAQIAAA